MASIATDGTASPGGDAELKQLLAEQPVLAKQRVRLLLVDVREHWQDEPLLRLHVRAEPMVELGP